MIFAIIEKDGKEQICCVDKSGQRAFPVQEFFQRDLKELCIESNKVQHVPESMDEWIENYNTLWTDDMALFFGSNPDLAVALDSKNGWKPLTKLDVIWSPLSETRGQSLLE
jgi:hypothetical protein